MTKAPRIVLLHATPVAMEPISEAFAQRWPEAETVNLLDDGLTIDRARDKDLSPGMIERFVAFGRYAHRIGADGILVTCSAFGPAIERMAAELPVPVLKPNEAMFRSALQRGRHIGMIATFAPSVPTMTQEFEEFVRETGSGATLTTIVAEGAIDHLRKGDATTHNRLVAEKAPELDAYDAIMLAHFSTSRAAEAVRRAVRVPVLTAPEAAVDMMQGLVASNPVGER
ncbi:MAG: arylsulfatase [Mesorhizobium sp.]|nr:aspartate/glutamate racemase family protein [Mesorhizobium sp.]MBN9245521.1 arylsulfatase [Mesorhizobium sp.]